MPSLFNRRVSGDGFCAIVVSLLTNPVFSSSQFAFGQPAFRQAFTYSP